ncbi:hypothetical protein D1007_32324 [Hordeum vulgare]|uniref:Uncharacterized protein n=1 Tax=Hordeum vulgare subsp. vulgare TaxID=112509 RepID=A0A8I6WYF6_HORVV|nr:uncharacterized protein LOC123428069 [Hordeum vulgare subsp. vulgare]KAE8793114.1 hypothetical protein D1007_32324 [Hordeum vulgare]KAI4967302.1 hypothetical protein ZWY2020_028734 [Hordeum vulgare]
MDRSKEWWQKAVAVPVRRAWVVVAAAAAARLRRKKHDGRGGALVKLHDDVQTCAYEDVQVMWEMLQRSETEKMMAGAPPPKGSAGTALVWLGPRRRHHSIDLRPRC